MTKQEEIREGIAKIIFNYTTTIEADELLLNDLLWYLDSQGVVIKGNSLGGSHPHLTNYFTVESLIKEK